MTWIRVSHKIIAIPVKVWANAILRVGSPECLTVTLTKSWMQAVFSMSTSISLVSGWLACYLQCWWEDKNHTFIYTWGDFLFPSVSFRFLLLSFVASHWPHSCLWLNSTYITWTWYIPSFNDYNISPQDFCFIHHINLMTKNNKTVVSGRKAA